MTQFINTGITIRLSLQENTYTLLNASIVSLDVENDLVQTYRLNTNERLGKFFLRRNEGSCVTLSLTTWIMPGSLALPKLQYTSLNGTSENYEIEFPDFTMDGKFYVHKFNLHKKNKELIQLYVELRSTGMPFVSFKNVAQVN